MALNCKVDTYLFYQLIWPFCWFEDLLDSQKVGNTEVVRGDAGDGVYAFDTRGPLMKGEKFETVSWQVSSWLG